MITYCVRFFPAAGRRHNGTGDSGMRNNGGRYWSSSTAVNTSGWYIEFGSAMMCVGGVGRTIGFTVRCVAYRG